MAKWGTFCSIKIIEAVEKLTNEETHGSIDILQMPLSNSPILTVIYVDMSAEDTYRLYIDKLSVVGNFYYNNFNFWTSDKNGWSINI